LVSSQARCHPIRWLHLVNELFIGGKRVRNARLWALALATARQPAPKHRIWQFFLETDVHQSLRTEYVACVVAADTRWNLPAVVNGRRTSFQAMNAGKSEKA